MFNKTTVLKKISENKDVNMFRRYIKGGGNWQAQDIRKKEFKDQFKKDPDVVGAIFHRYGMYVALDYATRANPFFMNKEIVMQLLTCNHGIRYVPAKMRKNEEVMTKYLNRCMSYDFNPEGIIFYVKPNCPKLLETAKWKKYVRDYGKKKASSINF
jgi:hypothetical protein